MSDEVSLLLVEDDPMVRGWVRHSLAGSEFRIAGEATTLAEAEELCERRRPAFLLVDYRLRDGKGTELVRRLRGHGFGGCILMMTANPEPGLNEAAREAGAQGSILKAARADELVGVLRDLLRGELAFDRRHPARSPGAGALSPRERQVLALVAAGKTNREIARQLEVGDETVKTLVARILAKLGVKRRAQAVAAAHERGLLEE